jgi:hypothetical protein
MIDSVRETQKKYGSRALMAAVLIGLVFILVGQKAIGKGLVLGTLFSIINFLLIGKTLFLRTGRSRAKTFGLSLGSVAFRFALMAIPLIAAIKFDQFNLLATICGIFMIQMVILVDHFVAPLGATREKRV